MTPDRQGHAVAVRSPSVGPRVRPYPDRLHGIQLLLDYDQQFVPNHRLMGE